MSNPTVTARSVTDGQQFFCEPPINVEVEVRYPFGSEAAALAALESHYQLVREQILTTKAAANV